MVCGVCGGVAEYFGVDPSIVRIIWGVGAVCSASLFFWVCQWLYQTRRLCF